MTDRFTKATEELQEKSAFVCEKCGHPHEIPGVDKKSSAKPGEEVRDRFSKAVKESGEKSAFVCKSCGHPNSTS